MRIGLSVASFFIRHFLLVGAGLVVACQVWTVVYFGLLVYALITDSGTGGPLAYPAGMLVLVCLVPLVGWGIFTPACGVGAVFCRWLKLPKPAAIPIVFCVAVMFFWMAQLLLFPIDPASSEPSFADGISSFAIYLAVPLGIYWWLSEGPRMLIDFLKRCLTRSRSLEL